jgi:hypothetical protein
MVVYVDQLEFVSHVNYLSAAAIKKSAKRLFDKPGSERGSQRAWAENTQGETIALD